MNIAIFGGSFDPMHGGHLDIIFNLFNKLNMDKVLIIPTNVSYYKKNTLMFTYNQRLELCKLLVNNCDKLDGKDIEILDIEKDILPNEGYAHTLKKLINIYPNDDLYTVIGSDSYNYINTWREYETIFINSKLVVVTRPGNIIDENIKIDYIKIELSNNISSTEVRKNIIDLIMNEKTKKN